MTRHRLGQRRFARRASTLAAFCAVAIAGLAGLAAAPATASGADSDRELTLTRLDGSPVGALFPEWLMVPGDRVTTTIVAHREGAGKSSLLIALDEPETQPGFDAPVALEDDVLVSIRTNDIELSATASALRTGGTVFDLGRSAATAVPIDITIELPFTSGNATRQQSFDLSITVTAADIPVSTPAESVASVPVRPHPLLPSTGSTTRDALILAAAAVTLGLLFLGVRRKGPETPQAH